MVNKVELLSYTLDVLSENHRKLLDVLIEKDSGEVRKLVDLNLRKNQELIQTIVNDFRELELDYVAPLPDGYYGDYGPAVEDDDEPISKVTMKMTERG